MAGNGYGDAEEGCVVAGCRGLVGRCMVAGKGENFDSGGGGVLMVCWCVCGEVSRFRKQ